MEPARTQPTRRRFGVRLRRGVGLLAMALAFAAPAWPQDDGQRTGRLAAVEGSAVYAPQGEVEWTDAATGRAITQGDRLWTDRDSRAQLRFGPTVLFMDAQTFLDIAALDDEALQVSLNQGLLAVRVSRVRAGENVEVDTPQLAFRATRAADFRLEVDTQAGITRVSVNRGAGVIYGAGGEAIEARAGDVLAFKGRHLEAVTSVATRTHEPFGRWVDGRGE